MIRGKRPYETLFNGGGPIVRDGLRNLANLLELKKQQLAEEYSKAYPDQTKIEMLKNIILSLSRTLDQSRSVHGNFMRAIEKSNNGR